MMIDTPRPEEFAFIFDSWARSFRKSPWAGCVPNHLWDQVSRECAKSLLDRGARALVAVTPIEGRPDERRVMGYSIYEPDRRVLHWLYVKEDFRDMGVGRTLLEATCPGEDDWIYTHRTRAAARFLGPRFRWDPVPARTK